MLRKTLKYDLNAIYKIWLILSVTVMVISLVGGLSLRDLVISDGTQHFDPYDIFSGMGVVVTVFTLSAYVILVWIFVLVRYYQNFFTDEAYLTFTLPVKRKTLFNSKLISAFIWSSANITVLAMAISVILSMTPTNRDGTGSLLIDFIKNFSTFIKELFKLFDTWAYTYIILTLLIGLLSTVFSSLLIYACITFGFTMVKRYKLFMGILVYYVVNLAISFLSYIGSIVLSIVMATGINVLAEYTAGQLKCMVLFTLIAIAMFYLVLCVSAYKFTLSRIEKNLNLA